MILLVFACIVLVSAWLWHHFWPRVWLASIGASLTSCILFQVLAAIELHFLDPFFLIGFVLSWVPAMAISLIVGFTMRRQGTK